MLLAQSVGVPVPTRLAQRIQQPREIGTRIGITDPQQRIRRFSFGRLELRAAVESQQVRHDIVRGGGDQSGLPAEGRRGVAHRGDGVAAVMLAVAPRAHAVLPRFAPVNRTDAKQNSLAGKNIRPPRIIDRCSLFEQVIPAQVVIDPGGQARQVRAQQIALGRMQIAAGRVAAQCPAVGAIGFPRRQPE